MASVTWTDVTDLAPELVAVGVNARIAILAVANTALDVVNWGGEDSSKLHLARCYYAAHFATLGMRKGKAGTIQSESAGGLSKSYANPMFQTTTMLQTTPYGQMYIALVKTTAARIGTTTGTMKPSGSGWGG